MLTLCVRTLAAVSGLLAAILALTATLAHRVLLLLRVNELIQL